MNQVLPAWKRNLPNQITWLRVILVPFIVVALSQGTIEGGYVAAAIFIIGSISDYFDGSLARKWGVVSSFGKFMDPIADKILVTSTLVMLIPSGRLDVYMVLILLARDTLISGLRSVAASENVIIPAGVLGKWKTAIQMVAIPAVLIHEPLLGVPVGRIGYWILWVSVGLSVISGVDYIWDYMKAVAKRMKK
ncbi:MAG: CDP-diacylglycerol--glycerol-3-phosphate 3-phosphatidyltransferase [Bdellovibrionales bacterium]|nr:CDP-diacylglycerol--glycerol-3-phosphate 3-phosphatidyltransferase [Bdellovibrionales bacterium]